MAYFKVEKDKTKYIIVPTAKTIQNYEAKNKPFCYSSLIFEAFNFSIPDALRYFISKYEATIPFLKIYPYFKITFSKKFLADEFCTEVNKRLGEKNIY